MVFRGAASGVCGGSANVNLLRLVFLFGSAIFGGFFLDILLFFVLVLFLFFFSDGFLPFDYFLPGGFGLLPITKLFRWEIDKLCRERLELRQLQNKKNNM